QAETLRETPVGRIQGAPSADEPLLNRTYRLVCGHVPFAVEVHGRSAITVSIGSMTETESRCHLPEVIRWCIRAVARSVVNAADDPILIAQVACASCERVVDPERAPGERDLVGNLVRQAHVGGGHGPEVTYRGVIGPLGVVEPVRQLGHDEIEVRIALPMGI